MERIVYKHKFVTSNKEWIIDQLVKVLQIDEEVT